MTEPSDKLKKMMDEFQMCWLPPNRHTIGMSQMEWEDEFQPQNFRPELEDIVKQAMAEGAKGTAG